MLASNVWQIWSKFALFSYGKSYVKKFAFCSSETFRSHCNNERFNIQDQRFGGQRVAGRCNHCGKRGHRVADCWHNPQNNRRQQESHFNQYGFNQQRSAPQRQPSGYLQNNQGPTHRMGGFYAGQLRTNEDYDQENSFDEIEQLPRRVSGLAVVCRIGHQVIDIDQLPHQVLGFSAICQADQQELSDESWLGDSGARMHMSPKRNWFSTYTPLPPGRVEVGLGDDHPLQADGIGTIKIDSSQGENLKLMRVLHVPRMKHNLFSLGEVTRRGY